MHGWLHYTFCTQWEAGLLVYVCKRIKKKTEKRVEEAGIGEEDIEKEKEHKRVRLGVREFCLQ